MAKITINEFSDNYSFNVGINSYATVALPITASWGPCYKVTQAGAAIAESDFTDALNSVKWVEFPSTPEGLDAFISTYRGATGNYRVNKDYSYQMAVTLLTAGYNVLVCRVANGKMASGALTLQAGSTTEPVSPTKAFTAQAKYPGTFGNNIKTVWSVGQYSVTGSTNPKKYWNVIVYIVGDNGSATAVENLKFVVAEPTDHDLPEYIYTLDTLESKYVVILNSDTKAAEGSTPASAPVEDTDITLLETIISGDSGAENFALTGGTDSLENKSSAADEITEATSYATIRYTAATAAHSHDATSTAYTTVLAGTTATDLTFLRAAKNMEWNYTAAYFVYSLLRDKLQYNPNRVVSPGWDDQNIAKFPVLKTTYDFTGYMEMVSPLHYAIMDAAYWGRCATGFLDIPKACAQKYVYDTSTSTPGYAQRLGRATYGNGLEANGQLYVTHCGLFAPWGNYKYVGVNRMTEASPSFLALLIQRAQILNQPIQYEWALPENRHHNLNIGKMQYDVNKATMDLWQKLEGVGVNIITDIPSLGTNLWGNSTLFEVPPATYQALANLSTRFLMNAVEDVAYKASLSVTFQYNNNQALSNLYSGITPILDTMKNVGAIEDYKVKVNPDINGEDHVNANTVIAKVYMIVNGVINDVVIDLYALPPGTDLNQFGE